jgi:signal transduction histidine kinase
MATAARSAADDCEDETLKLRVQMIVRAAERMLRTTQRVLSIASVAQPPNVEPIAPAVLLAEIAEDAEALGVPVDFNPPASLASLILETDRGTLEAIVQSLLNNAQDHGEPGRPISLTAVPADGGLDVTVSNVITVAKRHRGLGTGTYLCEQRARRMGANLTTATNDCTFTARLHVPA